MEVNLKRRCLKKCPKYWQNRDPGPRSVLSALNKSLNFYTRDSNNSFQGGCALCGVQCQDGTLTPTPTSPISMSTPMSNTELSKLLKLCTHSLRPVLFFDFQPENGENGEENKVDLPPALCCSCFDSAKELMGLYQEFRCVLGALNRARMQIFKVVVASFLEKSEQEWPPSLGDEVIKYWCERVGVDEGDGGVKIKQEIKDTVEGDEEDGGGVKIKMEIDDEFDGDDEEDSFIITPDVLSGKDADKIELLDYIGPENDREHDKVKQLNQFEAVECTLISTSGTNSPEETQDDDELENEVHSEEEDYEPPYHVLKNTSNNVSKRPQRTVVTRRLGKRKIAEEEIEEEEDDDSDTNDSLYQVEKEDQSEETDDSESSNELDTEKDQDHSSDGKGDLFEGKNKSDGEVDVGRIKRKYIRRKPLKQKPQKIKKSIRPKESRTKDGKRIQKRTKAQCSICGKWLVSGYSRGIHMRIHTGEKPFQCSFCPFAFYKKSNLTSHIRARHEKDTSHLCDICGCGFPEKARLRNHKATVHDVFESSQVYPCSLCDRKFVAPSYLKSHVQSAHHEKRISRPSRPGIGGFMPKYPPNCELCGLNFVLTKELKAHKRTEEHIKKFKDLKDEERHKRKDGPDKNPRASGKRSKTSKKCSEPSCTEEFPDLRTMLKHHRRAHPEKKHQCEICGMALYDLGNLRKHLRLHGDDHRFHCEQCGEKFHHKSMLKIHMTSHTGQALFNCKHCSEGFNEIKKYRRHMVENHPLEALKVKPFVCKPICWITFATQEEHENHMKSHEKTCKCNICGRWFPCATHLRRHRLLHTGEKPFKCEFCDKAFNSKENLKEHTYRHTGDRPHKCEVCNKGFFRKKELAAHRRGTECEGEPNVIENKRGRNKKPSSQEETALHPSALSSTISTFTEPGQQNHSIFATPSSDSLPAHSSAVSSSSRNLNLYHSSEYDSANVFLKFGTL